MTTDLTDADRLAASAGRHLDLVRAPFTLPSSRIIVLREGEGVRVHTSEYERSLAQCRVIDALTVRDAAGRPVPITASAARPGRVRRRGRDARLRRARRALARRGAPGTLRALDDTRGAGA